MCRMKDRKHMRHKKSLLFKSGFWHVYCSSCSVWKHETWYGPSLRCLQKTKKKDLCTRQALSTRENQEAFQMHALGFVYAEDTYLDIVIPAWPLAKNFLSVIYWAFVEGFSRVEGEARMQLQTIVSYIWFLNNFVYVQTWQKGYIYSQKKLEQRLHDTVALRE